MFRYENDGVRRISVALVSALLLYACPTSHGQATGSNPERQLPVPAEPDGLGQPIAADQPSQGPMSLEEGPIHEAFAEPISTRVDEGVVVDRQPPEPIDEIPPEYRPSGENVEWIPGYWFWLNEKADFVWVSGVWRSVPPGREWTPGYWVQGPNGYRWVRGFWSNIEAQQVEYLPYPPESLEQGPNAPPASTNYFWVPGNWQWEVDGYAWRPGYWYPGQTSWIWVPNRYVYTPRGAVYTNGYWDYPLQQRGLLYTPVYWGGGYGGGSRYTPSRLVNTARLLSSLFIDSNRGYYYYGAGYGQQNGYYPWYTGYRNNFYSPVYGFYAAQFGQDSAVWRNRFDGRGRGPGDQIGRDGQQFGLVGTLDDVRREMRQNDNPQDRQTSESVLELTKAEQEAVSERVRNLGRFRSARAEFESVNGDPDVQRQLEQPQRADRNQPRGEKVRITGDFKPPTFDLRTAEGSQELRQRARQRYEVMRPNYDERRDDAAERVAPTQRQTEERRRSRADQETGKPQRERESAPPDARANRRPPSTPRPRPSAGGEERRQRDATGNPARRDSRTQGNANRGDRRNKDTEGE